MDNIIENRSTRNITASFLARILRDRVAQAMIVMLVALAVLDWSQMDDSIRFTLLSLWQMLPFFALAIVIAAGARASGADSLVASAFSGNALRATIVAALIGAVSPFCSCGVIPLIAALLSAGVPLAPVMAFWIASPIMDPEMFVLTAAGIGFDFAVAKTLAAIAMGLLAGVAILAIQRFGGLRHPLRDSASTSCATSCSTPAPARAQVNWRFWHDPERRRVFAAESSSIAVFLGKWLTLAFFLESLMIAYVSSDWIAGYVGSDNPLAIPVAALVGAPSYLNGYAAIPLVSGLMEMGMTPGAAMAFVTAGAVSSIPAAIAVWALVKKPVFALYLLLGVSGATLTAWIYQFSGAAV